MGVVVTYDVSDSQSEVKSEMAERGYKDRWEPKGKPTHYLPDTTLWHAKKTQQQAVDDLKDVCANLSVDVLRVIAVPDSPWAGEPGEPHS